MQIENNEKILRLLFQKTMDKYKLTDMNVKGVVQGLRGVMTTTELHRMLFILGNLPSTGMKAAEAEILRGYQEELMTRLINSHLFVARNKEFHVVRRPGILLTYTYMGKICLAISERQLVIGNDGVLAVAEVGDFQYLPKPNRATTVGAVLKSWNTTSQEVDTFLQENYNAKNHREQVDIFYDDEFILLKYDRQGKFTGAVPEARMIPTISLAKGRVGPKPEDNTPVTCQEIDDDEDSQ